MSNNFSANELKIIINKLNGIQHGVNQLLSAVRAVGKGPVDPTDTGDEVIRLIESEDSDLAQTWRNTVDVSKEVVSKSGKILDRIEEELDKYRTETIRNEYNADDSISSIRASIESSKEALSQLDF